MMPSDQSAGWHLPQMSTKSIVSFLNASIRHTPTGPAAVRALTLRIEPTDAWVITGSLGAGKTTILDVS